MARGLAITIILLLFLGGGVDAQNPAAKEYLSRGDVQLSEDDVHGAISSYTRSIELDPSLVEAYIKRGMALRTKGNLNDAISDFEAAQQIDGQATAGNRFIAQSYSNRGYIEMDRLEIEQAITDFTKAIKLHGEAIHYYRRGQARLIDEDLEGAVADFAQALSLPQDEFLRWMIHANKGYALLLQGKKEEAQRDFDKCPRRNNGHWVLFKFHLRKIEGLINDRRRQRVERQKSVAKNKPAQDVRKDFGKLN